MAGCRGTPPARSDIRFRQLSFWEQHYWQIMALLLAVLLQPVLLAAIIFEHRLAAPPRRNPPNWLWNWLHMNRRATAGELVALDRP